MRVTILTIGSRGDVQPLVALGRGLVGAGYQVRLATHAPFADFVRTHGLEFAPLAGDPRELLYSSSGQAMLAGGRSAMRFLLNLRRMARPVIDAVLADCRMACADADLILFSLLAFPGHHIAEARGVPGVPVLLQPAGRTRHFPSMAVPTWMPTSGVTNWASHVLVEQLFWWVTRPYVNRWRESVLGLERLGPHGWIGPAFRARQPELFGYSPSVLPQPPDWHERMVVTGYWFLNGHEEWVPPPGLKRFLEAGPPPVYIGFGSMAQQNAGEMTELVLRALRLANQRGILLTGWGGLSNADLPETVYKIDSAPHEWLFPRMAALVHHGGAGTTAAGLRAGVPAQVIPFFGDQPFWAERVHQLGCGPRPIPRGSLNAEWLAAQLIEMVGDTAMRERAIALGAQIRAEDGVGCAIATLQEWFGDPREPAIERHHPAGPDHMQ